MSLFLTKKINNFVIELYKYLTIGIFLFLPSKVANVFVSLSILSLIYNVRNIDLKKDYYTQDKFKKLLNVSVNEEIMLLPKYTLHWFWKEKLLDKTYTIGTEVLTLREALINDKVLFHHLRYIVDILLDSIPYMLKVKLNLKDFKENLIVKHNVITLLIHR